MSLVNAKKRWQYLVDQIRYRDRLYYQENTSLSSDGDYDLLRAELNALEQQYPQLVQGNSPTQQVGYAPSQSFQKATHLVPLYSLDNVFDESQLEAFIQKACRFLGRWRGGRAHYGQCFDDQGHPAHSPRGGMAGPYGDSG